MVESLNSSSASGADQPQGGAAQSANVQYHGVGASRLPLWNIGEDREPPPPRRWLMANTFCRGFLSGIAAAGGTGKTALRLLFLLALATGRSDLVGEHVFGRFRVLFISLEDDLDEIRRRIWGATKYHRIPHAELLGWFWVINPTELKFARISPTNNRRIDPGELAAGLRQVIIDKRIDMVAIDPFVKTHEADENDNGLIDQVCSLLARIAVDSGCAIDIISHTAKGITKPGDPDRVRGASALRDALRLMQTLVPMSPREAQGFGLSDTEQRSLVRLDNVKVNLLPPATSAKWFRLVDVELGNRTDEYPKGDRVQTCERWYPPNQGAEISSEAMKRIFDQLEAGPTGGRHYSLAPNPAKSAKPGGLYRHTPKISQNTKPRQSSKGG